MAGGDPALLVTSPKHVVSTDNGQAVPPVMSVGGEVMSTMHTLPTHVADPEEMLLIFSEIAEAASARHTSNVDTSESADNVNQAEAPIFFKWVQSVLSVSCKDSTFMG